MNLVLVFLSLCVVIFCDKQFGGRRIKFCGDLKIYLLINVLNSVFIFQHLSVKGNTLNCTALHCLL